MADDTVLVSLQQLKPIRIVKWKVSAGCAVSIGRVILLYDVDGVQAAERRKLKSAQAGTVHELLAPEGAVVRSGEPLLRLRACIHPTVMKDMCAECGADLRKEETSRTASVPMVHSIPELKVSEEVAQKLGKADGERLIRDRKLVLLVDLDQTLIHTTNDNVPVNLKDVYHFQLYGPNSPWYHTRLRPGTHNFLSNISQFFELHICTFGARNYAHMIAMFLDNDQAYFANRILSRDECFDPTSKKANLSALFPCGDDMVCIIDDREDVWNHASNLIHVKPYHFFKHTGDINAPPGLDKHDADSKDGVDLSHFGKKTKLNGKREQVRSTDKYSDKDKDVEEEHNGVDTIDDKVLKTNGEALQEEEQVGEELQSQELDDKQGENETKADKEDNITEDNIIEGNTTENNKKAENTLEEKLEVIEETPENAPEEQVQTSQLQISEEEKSKENETTDSTTDESVSNDKDNNKEKKKTKCNKSDDDQMEIEDADDYLLYLEDILKLVHKRFYEEYDKLEAGRVPDLKIVIPAVRSEILKGCRLVFSGLVPTHIKLEQSKAYQVARSLGATVTQDIDDASTHLVAVRPGTAKVNAGRRRKHLLIVTPDWLWACAERWEHIEEAIFPLSSKGSKNRHPPPHCSSPEHVPSYPTHDTPAARKRTPSGRFMDTINPLMSFSSADIADMDKEVEDILDDDDSESDNDNDADNEGETETEGDMNTSRELEARLLRDDNSSSSEAPSECRGFKRLREECNQPVDKEEDSTLDDLPSAKFRRGEALPSDLDYAQESNSDGSVEQPDEADDGEWNMMGAALEREFLSNN